METILITGAEGFFASRFIKYYTDKYEVIEVNHKTLDITDEKQTLEIIKKIQPEYLVHAAAISDTGLCEKNPELSYKVNVKGSINVARACAETQTKLVYLSSDQIYNGNVEAGPYKEEILVNPNTVYGKHKLEAEKHISQIAQDAVLLRLTWLFGLPEKNIKTSSNIVWNVVKAALKSERLKLPVNEYRGITYVYDLIENFEKILGLPSGIYNTGSENNLNTYEIAKIILEQMGLSNRVEELLIKDTDRYKNAPRDLRICNKNLESNSIIFTSTKDAIGKCIKDFFSK
jgi:dTDP-4-dehydrorhamnose reductase